MALYSKTLHSIQRELYLYFPGTQIRTPFKRCGITVLTDLRTRADVETALETWGLRRLADEYELILSFPVPLETGWNFACDTALPDDAAAFPVFQNAVTKLDDEPPEAGIPSLSAMLGAWHPMNDVRYLIGIGSGASMALTLAACQPDNIAAMLAVGGTLHANALAQAVRAPVPAILTQPDAATVRYFTQVNDAAQSSESSEEILYASSVNPQQTVRVLPSASGMSAALAHLAWEKLFRDTRRTNTGAHGDIEPRIGDARTVFKCNVDEPLPGDSHPHTWFVHVPPSVQAHPERKVPVMMFFHGGSDNPAEAAEMCRFHVLGEREGFITVYPWGTNRCAWNSGMLPDQEDDVGFCARLIDYILARYPADASRVYLSGFSNGAAQAMSVALCYPEKVAAICPIDSNWPGVRGGYQTIDYRDILPFARGMERKAVCDYRMPVWYTYGSREPSYPVFRGSSQQNQYDYWKMYNHIAIRPTPQVGEPNPTGCGVTGDVSETVRPSVRHPHHAYDIQRFWSMDVQPENLYNYVIMRDKGHEVAEMDPNLGWIYVRQFRREPDGSLGYVE